MNIACALMSLPLMFRTCPLLNIAIEHAAPAHPPGFADAQPDAVPGRGVVTKQGS
jgi:hypothetical protein